MARNETGGDEVAAPKSRGHYFILCNSGSRLSAREFIDTV